tara:strand:+ start:18521 stop:18760 length:240 start_codon:yes stop_codon:yes gene_type:complete
MVINIDITKAKEVHKEELRIERREKFKELDVLYMRAQEAGEDTSDIVAKKQLLRDATKSVDNKDTTETIRAVKLPNVGV